MRNRIGMSLVAASLGLLVVGINGNANALTISGQVWSPASASSVDPEIVPTSPASANFTVEVINFDTRIFADPTPSYNDFLSGGPGNPNHLLWGSMQAGFDIDSFYTGAGFEGTFFQFTGVAYFAADTIITHDDGFFLTLNNTEYDYSTPVSPTDTNIHNIAGTYNFTLNYGATNSYPEVLRVGLTDPVPEPATMLLFGAGLAGLAGSRLRRKK